MQFLKSTPATLELSFYLGDTLTDLDANPTVVVTDDQGQVITSGTVSRASLGVYRATVNAPAYVTTLTAVWTGAYSTDAVILTQHYEVVGNLLFALAELRSYKSTLTSNDDKLVDARLITAELFESWCNVSFISRPAYDNVQGNASTRLPLTKTRVSSVTAAKINDVAVTPDIVHEWGAVDLSTGWTYDGDTKNVEVWYAHGFTQTPADIKRAAMEYAAYLLLSDVSTMDQRATGFTNELGLVVRYSPHVPTGLPNVDSTLARYKIPAVGRRR